MDRHSKNLRHNDICKKSSKRTKSQCQKECSTEISRWHTRLLFLLHISISTSQKRLSIPRPLRKMFSKMIQECSHKDRKDICDCQDRERKRIISGCRLSGCTLINLAQRHSSRSISASHNRKHIAHHRIHRCHPVEHSRENSKQRCPDNSPKNRRQIPCKRAQKQSPIKRQNRARHQKNNEKWQKIHIEHKKLHALCILLRNNLVSK